MATATLHLADVGGYPGPARCWKLDPPVQIDAAHYDYATVWVQPGYAWQNAEVGTVIAHESGAVAGSTVHRRAGSFTLQGDADTPEYIDGCHLLALQLLGGYTVRVQDES